MTVIRNINRRHFLKLGLAATGGLLVGCSANMKPMAPVGTPGASGQIEAWLHFAPDGTITFFVPASEMGQGSETGLTQIVADELDADWRKMVSVLAPYDQVFAKPSGFQATGGSNSIKSFWEPLRELGATARTMLTEAAAEKWQVPTTSLRTENGKVIHSDGRSLTYGDLASAAARRSPPSSPKLKSSSQFRYIGKPMPRRDTAKKINGSARYGIDVRLPDMLHAAVAQSPVFGGKLTQFDEAAAMASPGVKAVVEIPDGIAVVADSYWRAKKGLDALKAVFDGGANTAHNSKTFAARMQASLSDMEKEDFGNADQVLDVRYQVPFVAHQPMEPMNCTAHVTDTFCKIWVPTQNQHVCGVIASDVTGIPRDEIEVTTTYLGGGFGRRLEGDFVRQAVLIAKAVGKPVKVLWSREEDMQHDFYRPATAVRIQVGLDEQGRPVGWKSKLAATTFMQRMIDENIPAISWLPVMKLMGHSTAKGGLQKSVFEPNPFPYEVGDLDIDLEVMDFHVPCGSHRSVQHSYSGFYKESAIDECAHAAEQDPLGYRKKLIQEDPRYHAVLDLAATKAHWGKAPKGRFQGIAVHRSFDTYVAEIVELSVDREKTVTIHKVTCAVDCGIAVNPNLVKAQITGGVLWGLDNAFFGEISIDQGRVEQSNFHDYPVLRLAQAPKVDVHIVDSSESPTGVGEPGVPPIAAAFANALFQATGDRVRDLPFHKHGYSL